MTVAVSMTINGRTVAADIDPRTLLVQFIRETAGLTGTHVGCDTSQCGACMVLVDGAPAKSCGVLAVQADGHTIETIEGLADGDALHPMQDAFREHHGLQCGFCTPGMVMAAVALGRETAEPTDAQVHHAIEGNICRCTGYDPIVTAVKAGARAMHAAKTAAE